MPSLKKSNGIYTIYEPTFNLIDLLAWISILHVKKFLQAYLSEWPTITNYNSSQKVKTRR